MKKTYIVIIVLLVLSALGYFGYRFITARQQANSIENLQTVTASQGSLIASVGATGIVHSDQMAVIFWQTSGSIDHVYVQVGQSVSAGQVLADLTQASLPQNVILAQADLIAARDTLAKLTNPDLSTISTSEKALSAIYSNYQQAQNNLDNAIITNQKANQTSIYNNWMNAKNTVNDAQNNSPLANASIDIQAYYQAVRKTSQLQEELTITKTSAGAHPEDAMLAQKVVDLEAAVQESLLREDKLQTGQPADLIGPVDNLSDKLSAYDNATLQFISTVITDTSATSIDLARVQADLAQKQSDLISKQTALDDLINQRLGMNGKRCNDDTIADYQDAYDKALDAYNFTGHIPNSREYQLLQTAAANLNWCTSVWSESDIASQDAKISSMQAQIQLLQAQITADQTQIIDASNSVYGLAIYLNNLWTAYQDASQQLSNAVTTVYELKRSPNPDDLAAAQARLQAAQTTANSYMLTAPFAGTITSVNIKPGDQVSIGSNAFRLDNLNRLLVDVQVSEVDINNIQVGQPVELSFDAILNQQYQGVVSQVSAVGDAVQGVVQFNVSVELTNADEYVKPGMTAAVNIVVNQITDALLVPNRAVRLVNGQHVVYTISNNQLQQVQVTLGASSDTESQIIEGDLQVGDQIVLNPPQDLLSMGGPFGR
jgi:multidrug efflux pump subunit AcrA (membrane-fusion protein)